MLFDFLLPPSKENILITAHQLLRSSNVKITFASLKEALEGHPDYPSILSISDTYKKWNVDNSCLRVDKSKLTDLPLPFIAYTNIDGGKFLTVHAIQNDSILCTGYRKGKGKSTIGKTEFLQEWSGVCLLAESSAASGEADYGRRRIKEWLGENIAVLILLCCLAWMTVNFSSPPFYLLSWILLTGCIVTALLLWYDIDAANPVLQKICTAVKNTNCKTVVQSKAARLFGIVSWSEIGFFYFAGSFLYLQVSPPATAPNLLFWLDLLALPYTIFSVVYQWRVAKQWCTLCLFVQALLLMEFAVGYFFFWSKPISHAPALDVNTLPVFLIPVFFWTFSKSHLLSAKTGERQKFELQRLKSNKEIFQSLIQRQKTISANPSGLGIALGNPAATNSIIKVCNPYCNPCAKAHPLIDDLLRTHDNLKVQIIFTIKDDDKDHRAMPVRHLMALYDRNDPALIHRALDDWYLAPEKDYDSFAGKYPLYGELKQQGSKLQAMHQWCLDSGISGTPTIFVNGRQLPEIYTVDDLHSFMEE